MIWADYLFLFSLFVIWFLILYNVLLTVSAYAYREWYGKVFTENHEKTWDDETFQWPMVTVLIPGHNEEEVIYRTLLAIALQKYPQDKLEIIPINDGSTDGTERLMQYAAQRFSNIKPLNVPKDIARQGKSNALNYALGVAKGEIIAVYDADNTPDKNALWILIAHLLMDKGQAAVIGKFRTRNQSTNLLTRFINLETLGFQWIAQAGRAFLFKVVTIPGTNFVIWKRVLEELGGWDHGALTEDTELSIRIYQAGYRIGFALNARTWEEEPDRLKVWLKQRTRWARGNLYVIVKFLLKLGTLRSKLIAADIIHMFIVYFFFLFSILCSASLFFAGLLGLIQLTVQGPFTIMWILGIFIFVGSMATALIIEEEEFTLKNILLLFLMYFTYSQLWFVVIIRSIFQMGKDRFRGREQQWDKTQRKRHEF